PEAQLEVAALGIDVGDAEPFDDFIWRLATIDTDAAVTGALGEVEVAAIARRRAQRRGEIAIATLDLLHAHQVGALSGEPIQEPLVDRRADAVKIEREDTHARWKIRISGGSLSSSQSGAGCCASANSGPRQGGCRRTFSTPVCSTTGTRCARW